MTSRRSPSGRYYDWAGIVATLRSLPGAWAVRLIDHPARLVRTVEQKGNPLLHLPDGKVEARLVNEYTDTMGRRKGDVHLRFMPNSAPSPPQEGNHGDLHTPTEA